MSRTLTDQLFLKVLSQAIGDHKGNKVLRHQFMSAYEQACLWVEANGYGACTDDGAVLHADPFDVETDSAAILDTPTPCRHEQPTNPKETP
jgi:hypothetical protein